MKRRARGFGIIELTLVVTIVIVISATIVASCTEKKETAPRRVNTDCEQQRGVLR